MGTTRQPSTPPGYDLHRLRTIHVHCWSDYEFVVLLAGLVAGGLGWELVDQFVADDAEPASIEYRVLPPAHAARAGEPLRWRSSTLSSAGRRRSPRTPEFFWPIIARTIARDPRQRVPELFRQRPPFPSTCCSQRKAPSSTLPARWPRSRDKAAESRRRIQELERRVQLPSAASARVEGRTSGRHGLSRSLRSRREAGRLLDGT